MNINTDTVNTDTTSDGVVIEPDYCQYLRSHGYRLNDVSDARVVPSSSRDIGHVIVTIETTELPAGHDDLDVVADKTEIRVCSCEDFQYNKSVDVSEVTLREGSLGACRHIKSEYKVERAQNDELQGELDV